jgi:putative two-component system response regulator
VSAGTTGKGHVLIVERDDRDRVRVGEILGAEGFRCSATADAAEAHDWLASERFDLLVCDLAATTEPLSERARALRAPPSVLLVSPAKQIAVAEQAVARGVAQGYVLKPFTANEVLIGVLATLGADAPLNAARDTQDETIRRLCIAAEAADPQAAAHIGVVGELSWRLATRLRVPVRDCRLIRAASAMHDAGHMTVPQQILRKPGPLTAGERREMQLHTQAGHRILAGSRSPLMQVGARIAWTHHERVDGSGYPRGLRGDAIPLEGRIVAVADVFDSHQRDRPHRRGIGAADALAVIVAGRGTAFDPAVVDALCALRDDLAGDASQAQRPRRRRRAGAGTGPDAGQPLPLLTPREHEVLQLAAHGLSAIEIAEDLVVSPGTIKTHFQNIYAKLGASNRASAVAMALRMGIVS